MQVFQKQSNVVKFSGSTNNPGCKVLDRLELEEVSVRSIGPDGGTIKQLTYTKVLINVIKVDLSNTCLTRLIRARRRNNKTA